MTFQIKKKLLNFQDCVLKGTYERISHYLKNYNSKTFQLITLREMIIVNPYSIIHKADLLKTLRFDFL